MNTSVVKPVVSIVLPVYNAATTLTECIESIRAQSLEQFEVLAINDGSTDDSLAILQRWASADPRVVIIDRPHYGIVDSLNHGLHQARTELIARMDADDVMHPMRLQLQVELLMRQPEVDLVATQVELFPASQIRPGYLEYIRWQNAVISAQDIHDEIYVESPFAHPSVMYRKSVVTHLGAYRDGDFPEDYDLWLRMHCAGCGMCKLALPLLRWRESTHRISRIDGRYSIEAFDRLRAHYLVLDSRLKSQRPVVFWGAGRYTRKRTAWLINKGIPPDAWIDIDERKIGNTYHGAVVEEPAWLQTAANQSRERQPKPFVLSYVTNHGARQMIAEQLVRYGYMKGLDFLQIG